MYVIYNAQETTKLDLKFRKCLFLGYANGVKGYCLWDPIARKVIVNRDVIFVKDKIQGKEGDHSMVKENPETMVVRAEKESE